MANRKVLLVDDEAELVYTLAERMELRGYDVDAVTTGAEALQRIRDVAYDAVVVDLKMPGVNGETVLLKAKELHPHLPVIMLTGHGSTADYREEACAYLFKPVNIDLLLQTINKCIASGTQG